jgi:hypothetical protein
VKGDFSRKTFDPNDHHIAVALQQGRVLVDADWNEQVDLAIYDRWAGRAAIIGPSGGSIEDAAFRLYTKANKLWIGVGGYAARAPGAGGTFDPPGRYWVDGRMCQQEQEYKLDDQPHYQADLPTAPGYYLVWLDVFERLLTALDQPELREVALGGPDHATRIQQVWQVRLTAFTPVATPATCLEVPDDWKPVPATGRMRAQAEAAAKADPCVVPAAAGYRRLENQLYRVEIITAGTQDTARFVWSRDNGTVRVGAITKSWEGSGGETSIRVHDLGRDDLTRLSPGDWVEVSDLSRPLHGEAGFLCRIQSITDDRLTFDDATPLAKGDFDGLAAPTVRRWDGEAGAYAVKTAVGTWVELEDGVQVQFESGTYNLGDYWLIPARTTNGDIEFGTSARPPVGVDHRSALLGIARLSASKKWSIEEDCRDLFPPLTRLAHLHYVGGDGQEATPGAALPAPLEVAVTNGSAAVEGVTVEFAVQVPAGTPDNAATRLALGSLLDPATGTGALKVRVDTDGKGLAKVAWTLGAAEPSSSAGWSQHVTATVVRTCAGDPDGSLHFHATQSIAREVFVDTAACAANEEPSDGTRPALGTVQALLALGGLDLANPATRNVQSVLHALLCRLNAGHVPYAFPTSPAEITPASVDEVKSALDALYWLVIQDDPDCCLATLIADLADLIGGKKGEELCRALSAGPVDGECSVLSVTLGAILNLLRVLFAMVLAFLDLQDAPGKERGYEELRLGDEAGINLDAFVLGEGPGWFTTRVEEQAEKVRGMGESVLKVLVSTVEDLVEKLGIRDALEQLAKDYARAESWNGPATRWFILENIWRPVFDQPVDTYPRPRLDDRALQCVRDMVLGLIAALWKALVEVLLCGALGEATISEPKWLPDVARGLGEPLQRAFGLHGLVRELPAETWGSPQGVQFMGQSSDAFPGGATWLATTLGDARFQLAGWYHDRDNGPLLALADDALAKNVVLGAPNGAFRFTLDGGGTFQGFQARRAWLVALVAPDDGGGLEWWHARASDLATVEGDVELSREALGPFEVGRFAGRLGAAALVAGGPDDPPAAVTWSVDKGDEAGLRVWAPTEREKPVDLSQAARIDAAPRSPPDSLSAFTLDTAEGEPGRALALVMARTDLATDQTPTQRTVLLVVGGEVAWWRTEELRVLAVWDLPAGVSVVGGGHDRLVLRDDQRRRWTAVTLDALIEEPTGQARSWSSEPDSFELPVPADAAWRGGEADTVVHGQDGPWLQVLGPLPGRLGMYRAWSEADERPFLQRQMVRGAASGEVTVQASAAIIGVDSTRVKLLNRAAAPAETPAGAAPESLWHDYLRQVPPKARATVGERKSRFTKAFAARTRTESGTREAALAVTASDSGVTGLAGARLADGAVDVTASPVVAVPDQPVDVVPEQPFDAVLEQPVAVLADRPADVLAEQPADVLAEQPVAVAPEQTEDLVPDQPAEVVVKPPAAAAPLAVADAGTFDLDRLPLRLLTVCLRTSSSGALIEFNASPRA